MLVKELIPPPQVPLDLTLLGKKSDILSIAYRTGRRIDR
jgi:hypothetical protein